MAGDCEAAGNGIIITAVRSGTNNANNTAPDMTSPYFVQATCLNCPIDVEPEVFRTKGTTAASITFTQLDSEAAETFNVVVTYEIHKTP